MYVIDGSRTAAIVVDDEVMSYPDDVIRVISNWVSSFSRLFATCHLL